VGLLGKPREPVYDALLPQETPSIFTTAARINPNLARQVAAQRAANPRPDVTDLGGYGPDWRSYLQNFGNNVAQNYPIGSAEEVNAAATRMALENWGGAGIVKPSVAKALNTARNLPDNEMFRAAVANTPGAQITQDGLQMPLARSQQPAQALQPSVRGGVFYLPEGAEQMKNYSTGKHGYGGTEKITGDTLINNPLFAKGGTGGKAPEAAYDSLAGKGAYQKMRDDALHWSGGPREIREEAVTKFLEKYAPEMVDQAWYIIQNSTRGNQLAYALQEAAVGSAVRKAGHDAVLGHSMSRKTKQPFISEIFDVREMNYPDKFGTPTDIWDTFQK
jgi:hypothetical protein